MIYLCFQRKTFFETRAEKLLVYQKRGGGDEGTLKWRENFYYQPTHAASQNMRRAAAAKKDSQRPTVLRAPINRTEHGRRRGASGVLLSEGIRNTNKCRLSTE